MTAQRIDRSEVAAITQTPKPRGRPHDPNSVSGMLRAGHVVWLPGKSAVTANGYRGMFRGALRCRTSERDGVRGIYLWVEKGEA